MIKLSNFVSSCFTDCSGQGCILSPACGCYIVVPPQVKIWGGTMTQRWRVGFIYLHSDAQLWGASVGTSPSGSICSSLFLGGKQLPARVTHQGSLCTRGSGRCCCEGTHDTAPVQRGGQLRCAWPAATKVALQIHQDSLHLHGGLQKQIISCAMSEDTLGTGVWRSQIPLAQLFAARGCLGL